MRAVHLSALVLAPAFAGLFVSGGRAETATPEEMELVCQNWLTYLVSEKGAWAGATRPKIVDVQEIMSGDTVLGRCFSVSPRGYVVVPVLKELPPVKAYSEAHNLDAAQRVGFPQLLREALQHPVELSRDGPSPSYAEPAAADRVLMAPTHRRVWDCFLTDPAYFQRDLEAGPWAPLAQAGPLLSTNWTQISPYNDFCPMGDGGRTLLGCVVVPAAQIMRYHEWPIAGVGEHSFYWAGDESCGGNTPGETIYADFSDSYDWANMPDNCDSGCSQAEKDALAELNYEMAVAVEVDFGYCRSYAYLYDAVSALRTYFRYDPLIDLEMRQDHTAGSWFGIIQAEINAGRPMLYAIKGHALACDGWRDTGGLNQYHLNYGLGGGHTAWYTIDDYYCPAGGCDPVYEYLYRNIQPTTLPDCNDNGIADVCDLDCLGLSGMCGYIEGCGQSEDCNENDIPDECDIDGPTSEDCNVNGRPDECEIPVSSGGLCTENCDPDCNANGVPDQCDIAGPTSEDCNVNELPDECEIPVSSGGLCTENCDPDCNTNGIPDECDVATCWPGQPDFPHCDDCNRNGVPDSCDIAEGTSSDGNGNNVPDECVASIADGNWSDPNIWDTGVVPDSGAAARDVIIAGHDVYLDVPGGVVIDSLRILYGGNLYVFGAVDEDLTIVTAGGLFIQGDLGTTDWELCPESSLQVGNDRVIDVSAGDVTITAAGRYEGSSPVSALLSAQSVWLVKGFCTCPQARGGCMTLTEEMSVIATGDFMLEGADEDHCECCVPPERGGIAPPPKLYVYQNSTVDVAGDFVVDGFATVHFGPAFFRDRNGLPGMWLRGDAVNHSVWPDGFNWLNGWLTVDNAIEPGESSVFEVAGVDMGCVEAGFSGNFAMDMLEVTAGSDVKFVNLFDNTGAGPRAPEALYVGTLKLRSDSRSISSIIVDNCRIYYRTLMDEGASVTTIGSGQLSPLSGVKNRYVSFYTDGFDVGTAVQVEMTESGYFPESVGVLGWVGEPFEAPEDPGVWVARVVSEPYFGDDWPAVVHVGDCAIVPAATYRLRPTPDGNSFGAPAVVFTIAPPEPKHWADCVGSFQGDAWNSPDGVVNMDDVMAAVQKFIDDPNAPRLTWVDVDGEVPNVVLNFTDIFQIVQGFKSAPYPFRDPAMCP